MLLIKYLIHIAILTSVCSGQINEQDVLNNFSEDIAQQFCDASDTSCQSDTVTQLRSVKLSSYYHAAETLNSGIDEAVAGKWDWKVTVEGNSLGAFNKTVLLSRLSDDARVKTICEIGFNAGYSTLSYLISNPIASIVAFDIFEHNYTSLAVHQLHELFPARSLTVIAGDSARSVPMFHRMHPAFKCNLMFIDGGHLPHQLLTDLHHFRALADPEYHRVVIDDLQDELLMQSFQTYSGLHMQSVEYVEITPTLCIRWQVSDDGRMYEFDTRDEMCGTNSGVFRKGIVGVAEYVMT